MIQTPEDLSALYARIAEDRSFHVWIYLRPLEEAQRVWQGIDPQLPLYGQVFAVKDNIDVAGMPTTAGCPGYAYRPEQSSPVVQALEEAGALCLGKTNMDQFATGLVGTRSPYGPVRNAHVEGYIAGGSSSGSAVAVARGQVDFALGTDTAGSGRVPAALNRLVGLKPTRGRLSTRGVVPACRSLDCVTFFTPTVAAAARLLTWSGKYDALDPWSRSAVTVPERPAPWRIGVPRPHQLFFDHDQSARLAFASAVERWQALGHHIEVVDLEPFFEVARLLYGGPWVAERYAAVGRWIEQARQSPEKAAGLDPTVTSIILNGARSSAVDYFEALYRLQEWQRVTRSVWSQVDFLCLPTVPTCYRIADVLAHPVELNSRLGTYTNFVNLLDLCAITVPHGTLESGVPTGPTFIAPAFHDEFLLTVAVCFLGEPNDCAAGSADNEVEVAVVGAHLRGQPLHEQLRQLGARFLRETRTAPSYRLYELSDTSPRKPGLRQAMPGEPGAAIEVETYALRHEALGRLVASIPPPLCLGSLRLEDGRVVKGFLCEPAALSKARDISQHGGWRAWLAHCAA